jgi:hypothetical protein
MLKAIRENCWWFICQNNRMILATLYLMMNHLEEDPLM